MNPMIDKEPRLLVSPYENPDLDGSACAYGYTEFLRKSNRQAIAGVFGTPDLESQFVFETFDIPRPSAGDELVEEVDGIVIVDASDMRGLSDKIDPAKVVEVIDHRKVNDVHAFPNAKVQIEMVGAAATLIAEKFQTEGIFMSPESAALLFSAIVSNTVNFKAGVTTDRDSRMADWCLEHFSLPENYVSEMFSAKSQLDRPLEEVLMFATFDLHGQKVGVAQLEIINVDRFIETNLSKIERILSDVKKAQNMDMVLLTCIDVEKAFNVLVACDEHTRSSLEKAVGVKFHQTVAKRPGVLMRKEIVPLLQQILER